MIPVLSSASDALLAAAVEENLFALFRVIATLPGSEIVESERLSYHLAPLDAPMFKGVWDARLSPEEVDNAIEQTVAMFQAKGSPFVTWWFNQHPQPANLLERLEAHSFTLDYDAPGMALDLDTLDESTRYPDGFTVVPVVDDQTLEDWRIAFCAAYEMPSSRGQAWLDATRALGLNNASWRLYVGYWNGQPVATDLLFNGAGVSGLYCVGTAPETRGRGFGAAVTLKPLLDARTDGYRYSVLFASEEGLPMYKRLGFREVDILIGRYVWERKDR